MQGSQEGAMFDGLRSTDLTQEAVDYRQCDFSGPTAFVLGAEKWGLSESTAALVDRPGAVMPPSWRRT